MDEAADRHELQLYLLRHAHAGDPDAWTEDDASRPLSDKGRRQAEAMAAFLARLGFAPDAVLTSPKVRAAETADIVGRALGLEIALNDRLADHLGMDELAAILDGVPGRRIVLVGHDPDFSELAAALSGAGYVPLRKGALARIDVSLPLQRAGGILRWLLPPELVMTPDAR